MVRTRNVTTQLPLTYNFEDWCYWSDLREQFQPLPGWATFFMSLGKAIAELPPVYSRTLTALSVPTARFAAALSLAGYLLGSDDVVPLEGHIKLLRSVEKGRQVWLNKETKRIKGSFDGIVQTSSGEGVRVTFMRGRQCWTETYPLTDARRVQLASNNSPTKRSTFISKVPISCFAEEALRSAENPRAWKQAKVEAVIVGQKSRLQEETTEIPFSISRDGMHTKGFLQEVIRTVDFGEARDAQGFASAIEVPNAAAGYEDLPELAVFDGPRSFMRANRRHHNVRHWLVILDRTSRGFADGVAAVDEFYLERRDHIQPVSFPTPPAGIEMTVFERGN